MTPLATVKKRFESKEKLVEAVKKLMTDELWIERLSSDRGGVKGIERVSNAKLIRLHDTISAVKKEFGTRAKLIDAIADAEGRPKDGDYKKSLEAHPVPRLYDHFKASKRRGRPASRKPKRSKK